MYSRPKTAVVLLLMCIATFAHPLIISDASASIEGGGIFLFSLRMIGFFYCGPVLILIGLHTLGGVLLCFNGWLLVVLYIMLLLPPDGVPVGILLSPLLAVFPCSVILQFIRN